MAIQCRGQPENTFYDSKVAAELCKRQRDICPLQQSDPRCRICGIQCMWWFGNCFRLGIPGNYMVEICAGWVHFAAEGYRCSYTAYGFHWQWKVFSKTILWVFNEAFHLNITTLCYLCYQIIFVYYFPMQFLMNDKWNKSQMFLVLSEMLQIYIARYTVLLCYRILSKFSLFKHSKWFCILFKTSGLVRCVKFTLY